MDYTKFYTPPAIAELLIKQIHIKAPSSIIDICCGSCNLLYAARKKWRHATLLGVDIIKHSNINVNCIVSDGREYAVDNAGKYSLVLANPPFDFVKKKREHSGVFSEIAGAKLKYETNRLENEMLLANLKLLNTNGTLLIIMPNTFVESDRNINIRAFLASHYYVQKIIRLPRETFGIANIGTYAIIIKKCIPRKKLTRLIDVRLLAGEYKTIEMEEWSQKHILDGHWHPEKFCQCKNNSFDIKRGTISSHLFSISGEPVLHTAKSQSIWIPSVRCVSQRPLNEVYAESGDILISRIGKSAGQWHVYNGNRILISDCLYRLKDTNGEIARNLAGEKYGFSKRGVSTPYITINDFLNWYDSLG